jgi:protein-L-isoaspartate(D-aspartate) O-methyltransferase
MVANLVERSAIRSERVRRAFLAVPREHFVASIATRDGLEAVYQLDAALPTRTDRRGIAISSSSATAIMAPMLEALDVRPGMRILEIGTGTGYNAALLARLVGPSGQVMSVELDAEIAASARRVLRADGYPVRVVTGDGRAGCNRYAPFDRVIVTASACAVPRAWRDQLVEGGLVEFPLRFNDSFGTQLVATFRRDGAQLRSTEVISGGFMALRDNAASDAPALGSASVNVSSEVGMRSRLEVRVESPSLASLTDRQRRGLVECLLQPGRPAGARFEPARAAGLRMFLALSGHARVATVVIDGRVGTGVLDRAGTSAAAVTGRFGGSARAVGWGDDRAASELVSLIQEWERAGRPRLADLRLTLSEDAAEVAGSWRTRQQGDFALGIDWSSARTTTRRLARE